jgi:hypothetical protein
VYVRSGERTVAHATLNFLNSYQHEKPKGESRNDDRAG